MFDRFTDDAKQAMHLARSAAQDLRHEELGALHIALGLFDERALFADEIRALLGLDPQRVRAAIEATVERGAGRLKMGNLPFTAEAQRALEGAFAEATRAGGEHVAPEHLLLGVLAAADDARRAALAAEGVTADDVRERIARFRPWLEGVLADLDAARTDDALRRAQELVEANPTATSLTLLAMARRAAGRAGEAEAAARRAVDLDPSDPRALTELAFALDALGRADEAETCRREAGRLRGED